MTPHERIVNTSRQVQAVALIVAAVYAAGGLWITIYASVSGQDAVNTVAGLMIFSFAVSWGVLLVMVMRLGERISTMAERVDGLDSALGRIERAQQRLLDGARERAAPVEPVEPAEPVRVVRSVDLAAVGPGDPSRLAGAVLDRARFPRLATSIEERPDQAADERSMLLDDEMAVAPVPQPASAGGLDTVEAGRSAAAIAPAPVVAGDAPVAGSPVEAAASVSEPVFMPLSAAPAGASETDLAGGNLLRAWAMAVRHGELAAAREVFSALVDVADEEVVADLRGELFMLEHRVEKRLRAEFARCVRESDYEGALAAGREMTELLPGSAVTADFARLEPHLRRRLAGMSREAAFAPTP